MNEDNFLKSYDSHDKIYTKGVETNENYLQKRR